MTVVFDCQEYLNEYIFQSDRDRDMFPHIHFVFSIFFPEKMEYKFKTL